MKKRITILTVIVLTAIFVSPVSAAAGLIMNTWVHTSIGLVPNFPTGQAFAFLPSFTSDGAGHVFVGTSTSGDAGGLFKSTDSGVTWTTTALNNNTTSLAVSPNYVIDHLMVAGTASDGVWMTTDEWTTPVDITKDPLNATVSVVSFSPNYAADHLLLAGTQDNGLYMTLNLGSSWIVCAGLPDNSRISGLTFTPNYAQSKTLFVAVNGEGYGAGGVYQGVYSASPSPHFAWTTRNNGLTNVQIRAMAISPNYLTDSALYVGTYGSGLFKTSNSGGKWTFVDGSDDLYVQALAISPDYAYDHAVYLGEDGGGVYRYVNFAVNPTLGQMNAGFPDPDHGGSIKALAFAPGRPRILFAGYLGDTSYGGVWQYLFPVKIFLPLARK
jgi:hypothetical protein